MTVLMGELSDERTVKLGLVLELELSDIILAIYVRSAEVLEITIFDLWKSKG